MPRVRIESLESEESQRDVEPRLRSCHTNIFAQSNELDRLDLFLAVRVTVLYPVDIPDLIAAMHLPATGVSLFHPLGMIHCCCSLRVGVESPSSQRLTTSALRGMFGGVKFSVVT